MNIKKKISIVTPCYNEEGNVRELYNQVKLQFEKLCDYTYEHIFIDNASKDGTVSILRELAQNDKNVKLILNIAFCIKEVIANVGLVDFFALCRCCCNIDGGRFARSPFLDSCVY